MLERLLKSEIYDLFDDAGVAYKTVAIGFVNDEESLNDLLDKQDPEKARLPGFRSTDPDTSRKGAIDAYPRVKSQRHKALIAIAKAGDHGLTDEEVEEKVGIEGVWKRCSELVQGGFVEEAGERRVKKSGSMGRVLKLTPRGEKYVEVKEGW